MVVLEGAMGWQGGDAGLDADGRCCTRSFPRPKFLGGARAMPRSVPRSATAGTSSWGQDYETVTTRRSARAPATCPSSSAACMRLLDDCVLHVSMRTRRALARTVDKEAGQARRGHCSLGALEHAWASVYQTVGSQPEAAASSVCFRSWWC